MGTVLKTDTENVVSITREYYWVGFSEKQSRLKCNPYLLIDSRGEDVVLFDPGSIPDFPVVMRKVIDVIPPETISLIVVFHQDPDVCGNLAVLEDVIDRGDLKIAAHLNTVRLIEHLGLRSEFYAVDQHDYRYTMKSGRELEFIYLPFLHSPGAIATFDSKTSTLISGDLFGAISDDESLFVPESFPQNMDSFHQAYMPTNSVLRHAMERLEKYDIKRILPQHGSIIEDEEVGVAIKHLKSLPCGIDLMEI